VAYHDLRVPWYSGFVHCTVWFGFVHGRRCFFIDPHSQDEFFNCGQLYGFHDDVTRFAFFSKAALEFMLRTNRQPDVIHCHDWQTALCHDWQTALVPVLLFEIYQHIGMNDQRVCFTIHNFAHQGVTGEHLQLRVAGRSPFTRSTVATEPL
jgi:starch synthase